MGLPPANAISLPVPMTCHSCAYCSYRCGSDPNTPHAAVGMDAMCGPFSGPLSRTRALYIEPWPSPPQLRQLFKYFARRASSRVAIFAAGRRPLVLEVNVGQRFAVVILHDEAGVGLFGGPERREAAREYLAEHGAKPRIRPFCDYRHIVPSGTSGTRVAGLGEALRPPRPGWPKLPWPVHEAAGRLGHARPLD